MPVQISLENDPTSPVEVALDAAIQALRGSHSSNKRLQAIDELSAGITELGITDLSQFRSMVTSTPHELITGFWNLARITKANNSLRGGVFEHLIELILVTRGITPLYTQVTLSMVPNVRFDLVAFPKTHAESEKIPATGPAPICMSLKTSLRERYKQAELEAAAAKGVYRWAKCYLLTLDSEAAKTVNAKIRNREVAHLESVIVVGTTQFDEFIEGLALMKLIESPQIPTIHSNLASLGSG